MNSESKESWIEVVGNCFGVNQMMCFVVGDHEIPDDAVMLPAYDISNLSPPFPPLLPKRVLDLHFPTKNNI